VILLRNNFAKLNVFLKSRTGVAYVVGHRTYWADFIGIKFYYILRNEIVLNLFNFTSRDDSVEEWKIDSYDPASPQYNTWVEGTNRTNRSKKKEEGDDGRYIPYLE